MKISIGSDHAGFNYKELIKKFLEEKGHNVIDEGPFTNERCNYPDFALKVAKHVSNGDANFGILICGTGIGMSIAANKIKGIRAARCSEALSAKLSRLHNDANVLCFGERIVGYEIAKEMVEIFINTNFEGGRHKERINIIKGFEDGKK